MMASKLLHGLFYIFFVEQISTDKVNIVGPDFVKIGEPIYIRCMSDVPSFAETAEFKVNNIRYTIIRKQSNGCFSSREGSRCSSTLCQCSSDGKAFSLKIIAPKDKYALRISCIMTFIKDGKQFSSEAVLAVSVLGTPILEIDDHNNCNTSASINLTCNLSGGPNALGFGVWTHSFEGKFIRNLNGSIRNKTSVLEIETCKDQDLGEYTCNVWSSQNRQLAWTHKTTMVNVNGPPLIVKSGLYKNNKTTISIEIISLQSALELHWFHGLNRIENDHNFGIYTSKANVSFDIYGSSVLISGFVSNLTLNVNKPGIYEIVTINEFGRTRRQIQIQKGKAKLRNDSIKQNYSI